MQTIGDYEYNPKDELGAGWFGVVYKGRSKKNLSTTVAIKTIKKRRIFKNDSTIAREMEIMSQIHHENVVALFNYYEQGRSVFFVMEYCNGGDLKTYLKEKKLLDENTIHLFLILLADGMKALYDKNIIHRDLKPKNILIKSEVPNPEPSQIKLKIADFGLARFLPDDEMAGTLCGTPFYMAPEVILKLPYDAKADMWSLGAIVFKCLTGKRSSHILHLIDMSGERETMKRHGASAKLTDLLMRMLKRDQNQRINFDQFYHHEFLR